jgi:hypothetical protein
VSSCGKPAERTGVRAPGAVNRTIGAARVQNANLFDTLADGGHRLKVVRLVASLDLIELITRVMPRILGKVAQHLSESPKEALRPHDSIISNWI